MQLGMVGLGKMGGNMARRLLAAGHAVVGHDRSPAAVEALVAEGARGADGLEALAAALEAPRAVWLMVPAGAPVDGTLQELTGLLSSGDTIIDGGNSFYRDSQRRARALEAAGVHFVDVGTSGGVWGLEQGYSLMVGGEAEVVERLRPLFEALAPGSDRGWGHVGPAGAGHFAKMVHNGIEYGLMQAYAEGFALLRRKTELALDPAQVAEIWRHGSVVRSWLLDLVAKALRERPDLEGIEPWVEDSGEGRWTLEEALELAVSTPALSAALFERFTSRDDDSFSHRLLAALRQQFGGHGVRERRSRGDG